MSNDDTQNIFCRHSDTASSPGITLKRGSLRAAIEALERRIARLGAWIHGDGFGATDEAVEAARAEQAECARAIEILRRSEEP